MDNAPSWLKLLVAVILAAVAVYGAVRPTAKPTTVERIGSSNCEAINEVKALARELIALSPPDPDYSAEERAAYTAHVYELTRPQDCSHLVNP